MYSSTEIREAMDLAIQARAADDLVGAIKQGEIVLAMMSVVADLKKFGHAGAEMEYDREAVKNLLDSWRRSLNAANLGQIQTSKISYVGPRCTSFDDHCC